MIFSSFCFYSLSAPASSCEDEFGDVENRPTNQERMSISNKALQALGLKNRPANQERMSISDKALQALGFRYIKKYPSLLEELENPALEILSTVRSIQTIQGNFFGNGIPPLSSEIIPKVREGEVVFGHTYVPSSRITEDGYSVIFWRMNIDAKTDNTYQHWIYWRSDARDSRLSKDKVKRIFNKVYEEAYGESLEWMIAQEVIPKMVSDSLARKVNYFEFYDLFRFNSLFFKNNGDRLRRIIMEGIRLPSDQGSSMSKEDVAFHTPSKKMTPRMRELILRSHSVKELDPEYIRSLEFLDLVDVFNTPEKIKTLDLSLISPDFVVRLLRDYRLWRSSITPEQIQQIDVTAKGIQYVFVPTFKDRTWVDKSEIITLDKLSDAQIMSMHRDTFLRDVFLAGDLFTQGGYTVPEVKIFMAAHQNKVKEIGLDAIVEGSLSSGLYNFISRRLGFDMPFALMDAQKKRELFEAQIALMTDFQKQVAIITDIVRENRGMYQAPDSIVRALGGS